MSHLDAEVANHNGLIRDLMAKVDMLAARKSDGGIIMPPLPGPGAATLSRSEYQRSHGALVNELEALKAELALVSEVAFEAVRILDRLAGMGGE